MLMDKIWTLFKGRILFYPMYHLERFWALGHFCFETRSVHYLTTYYYYLHYYYY